MVYAICLGLKFSGLSNITTLSFRRNNQITAQGLSVLAGLINLLKLDFERCPGIRGGLVHLKGLFLLKVLWSESKLPSACFCISALFGVAVFETVLNFLKNIWQCHQF